jgi:hypothetical protein
LWSNALSSGSPSSFVDSVWYRPATKDPYVSGPPAERGANGRMFIMMSRGSAFSSFTP